YRRGGGRSHNLHQAAPPLHRGADALDPAPGPAGPAAAADPGGAAQPDRPARPVSLPATLPQGDQRVSDPAATAARADFAAAARGVLHPRALRVVGPPRPAAANRTFGVFPSARAGAIIAQIETPSWVGTSTPGGFACFYPMTIVCSASWR